MIDTHRQEISGVDGWGELLAAVRQEFAGATFTEGQYTEGAPWQAATWKDPDIGTMGCKCNRTGAYLWVETSLGKYAYGDNCRLLTHKEALECIDGLCGAVEAKYRPFLPGSAAEVRRRWQCTRADLYYQRDVPSVPAVCAGLAQAFGNKAKLAQYLTSVEYMQSRDYRARFYGKGFESGNEAYINTLRHEEQIRGRDKAGYFVDVAGMTIRASEARGYMNKRFQGWPDQGLQVPDIEALLEEHGAAGAAAVGLVLLPSLEPTYKRTLAKETFYKYRRLATEYKRRNVTVDLRVPAGAWGNDVL